MFTRGIIRTFLTSQVPSRAIKHKVTLLRLARMASSLPRLPIFEAIASHDPSSIAVVHSLSGRTFTYGKLLGDVVSACDKLQAIIGNVQLDGQRIAFLVENSYDYVGAECNFMMVAYWLMTFSYAAINHWSPRDCCAYLTFVPRQ